MSATYFDKFQKVLQSQQPPLKELSRKEGLNHRHSVDEDSDTSGAPSRPPPPRPRSADFLWRRDEALKILRVTVGWNRPNGDLSPPNLVRTVQCEVLSQPWTKWEPSRIDFKFPAPVDLEKVVESSGSPTLRRLPKEAQIPPLTITAPAGRVMIHYKFLNLTGGLQNEYLRLYRRSPVLPFLWSRNYGLNVFEEANDLDFVETPGSRFPALFFMNETIQSHVVELEKTTENYRTRPADLVDLAEFKAFHAFIDGLFPNARLEQSHMRQSGQVSFDFLWTLFPPNQILYEKQSLPFCDEISEQCLRVLSIEKSRSYLDGVPVWHLILQDVVYRRRHEIGPCLVTTHRYVRFFSDLKPITDQSIGLIPLDMISQLERTALIAKLSHIGHRCISICSQPWTIWEYEGPVLYSHPSFSVHFREEYGLLPDNKPWQRYTRERVIVDVFESQADYQDNVDRGGWVDEFLDQTESYAHRQTLEMNHNRENPQHHGVRTEELYLICRSHVPAFLLTSGTHAIGIFVSLLKVPVWGNMHKTASLSYHANSHRDLNLWKSIVGDFMSPKRTGHHQRQGRPIRRPGLVLLFRGPQRITREMTTSIAEDLQKPLVIMTTLDSLKDIDVVLRNVLRWGGILLIEDERIFSHLFYERCITHPGVVFLTSNKLEEIPDRYLSAIDSIIDCNIAEDDCWEVESSNSRGLWYHYLVDELPELVKATTMERLRRIAEVLASVESREARMAKTLLTAKRLAQSGGEAVREDHIFEVIRQALALKDVSKFEGQLEKLDEQPSVVDGREEQVSRS